MLFRSKSLERFPGGKRLLRCRDEAARAAAAPLMTLSSLLPPLAQAFGLELDSGPVPAFQKFVEQWEGKPLPGEKTLHGFLEYLEYFVEAGGTVSASGAPTEDAVRLMTIHAAKGLEFPQVCVIRVDWRGLPAYREPLFELPRELRPSAAIEDPKEVHDQEELRLFYVAMTRARDLLTLSSGCLGGKKNPVPERFLRQLAGEQAAKSCWQGRRAPPYRVDVEAGAAAVSAVAPWMQIGRASCRERV